MTAMNDHDKLSALVAEWRADRPIITGGGYEEYRAAQNECADELEAALAALSQGEGEKPVAWWNGIGEDVTERSGRGPSIRWGADGENGGHDIPLYAGYNPVHFAKPTHPEAQQPEAVACDDIPPCPVWLAGKDASIAWAAGWKGAADRTALQAQPAEGGVGEDWRPISEAPMKDGTILIGWGEYRERDGYSPAFMRWYDIVSGWTVNAMPFYPTHWKPLPAAPKPATTTGEGVG